MSIAIETESFSQGMAKLAQAKGATEEWCKNERNQSNKGTIACAIFRFVLKIYVNDLFFPLLIYGRTIIT